MSNYSENVSAVSAQQVNPLQLGGLAPGQNAQSALELMFGPATTTQSRRFGQDISSTHQDLYAAYEGDNLYLADTIIGFVLRNIEWFTSVVPWLQTNQMHVQWNTFEFNRAMAQAVPAEGISRIISHKTRSHTGSTSRYGIAFIMEGDMIGSEEGRVLYRRNIQGISQSCQETVNYHTVHQLLSCKNYIKERQQMMRREGDTLRAIEDLEALDFATLAYNREGFTRMIEKQRDLMRDYDGEADALIVFPRFVWYEAFVLQGTYTEYYQTGPRGIQLLTEGPIAPGTFRGIPVFESRDFNVQDGGVRLQPLASRVAVGEYYPVTFEPFRGHDLGVEYGTHWRDIAIYDIEKDHYKKVTFKSIFLNSRMFGGQVGDEDGLSPAIRALKQDVNASFNVHGGFEAEALVYGNPALLETTDSVKAPRRVYMHLAHNVEKRCVSEVKTFGQFDVDVVTTNDFLQSARTLIARLFESQRDCADVECKIEDLIYVVGRLEAAPYNEKFLRALSHENADNSIDSDGAFVGFPRRDISEAIDWNPNAYGGMDLPSRFGRENEWPVEGSMIASYPMIVTLAAQGEARGYQKQGDDLIPRAKSAIAGVRAILSGLMRVAKWSAAIGPNGAPDWIHGSQSEASVFNMMMVSRPPVFLGVVDASGNAGKAQNPPRRAAAEEKKNKVEKDEQLIWQSGLPGDQFVASTVPRYATLMAVASMKSDAKVDDIIATLAAGAYDDDGFLATVHAKNPMKLKEVIEFRDGFIDAANRLMATAKGQAKYVAFARDALAAAVNKMKEQARADNFDIDNAVAWLALIHDAEANSNSYNKRLKKLDQAQAEANLQTGADILRILSGEYPIVSLVKLATGETVVEEEASLPPPPRSFTPQGRLEGGALGDERGARSNRDLRRTSIRAVMSSAIKPNTSKTFATVLRELREQLDATVMTLEPFVGQKFEFGKAQEFQETLVLKGAPSALIDEFTRAQDEYFIILNDINARIASTINADNSFAKSGNEQARTDAVPGDAATAYHRAPLAMSPAALRSLAAFKPSDDGSQLPIVFPADPQTHYRQHIEPTRGQTVSVPSYTMMMGDPAMGQLVAGRMEAGSKPLWNEPSVRKLMTGNAWFNRYASWSASKAGKQGNDALSVALRQRSDGTVGFEDEALIAAKLDAINSQRAAAGLPEREIGLDFAQADEQRRELERKLAVEKQRRQTIAQLGQTASGAMLNVGVLGANNAYEFNPVKRAMQRSRTVDLAAPLVDPSSKEHAAFAYEQYPYKLGAYPGARTNTSAQYQVTRGNDLLPDPRFMREPMGYIVDGNGAFPDPAHPYGHGLGYDHSRGYAVANETGIPSRHAAAGLDGNDVMYDAYGRKFVRLHDDADGVVLGRDGRVIQEGEDQSLCESDQSRDALHPNSKYRFAKAQEVHSPLERLALLVLYEMPNTATAWVSLIDNNIHVPINFLVWRLHIEFDMYTCILMQSGIETAANMLGPSSMVFTNSGADKMMHGHFTFHHAPIVFKEQYVAHLRHVYPKKYIAGWDTNWVMSADEMRSEQRGSMIATPIAITENIDAATINFNDVTRPHLQPAITNRTKAQRDMPDYSSAAYAERIWQLSEDAIMQNDEQEMVFESDSRIQTRACRGKMFSYNPQTRSFSVFKEGTGHLSQNRTGPGVARVWRGLQREVLPDQNAIHMTMTIQ